MDMVGESWLGLAMTAAKGLALRGMVVVDQSVSGA
jgi:hypothetical protein